MRRLLLALAEHGERRAHARPLQRDIPAAQRVPPALVELTAGEWARLRPLLPPQRPRTGRPRNDHRAVVGGILWVLRNRASWRDMPARFGNYNTAYKRYRLWSDTGL